MVKFYAEEGDITIFRRKFFFSLAKLFVGVFIQCFRKIQAWKNFLQKKAISLISVETSFFSQCRKISWEELINVSEILAHGKIFCRRRRYHYFLWELFFPTVPNIIVNGIIQCVRKIRAWKNFMQKEGISLFSVGTFFSHSADKFRVKN